MRHWCLVFLTGLWIWGSIFSKVQSSGQVPIFVDVCAAPANYATILRVQIKRCQNTLFKWRDDTVKQLFENVRQVIQCLCICGFQELEYIIEWQSKVSFVKHIWKVMSKLRSRGETNNYVPKEIPHISIKLVLRCKC